MKLRLAESGPPVDVPTFLGAVLLVDLLLALGVGFAAPLLATTGAWTPRSAADPWWIAGYCALLVWADVACARLRPRGLTWRRRLGYLGMGALVWREGAIVAGHTPTIVLGILWLGVVWIALVVGGLALSRAIASVTGEDKPE